MKPNSKKNISRRSASRSSTKASAPAKKRKVSAKKSALREKIILVPVQSGGNNAAILIFDEANVLFGRRTTVRDSHDRYANLTPKALAQKLKKPTGRRLKEAKRKRRTHHELQKHR